MGRFYRCDMFGTFVPQRRCVNARQKMLTNAKQDRGNGDVQLVDQASLEVLADRAHAAAQPYILTIGCCPCLFQGRLDAVGDKVEGGTPLHGN